MKSVFTLLGGVTTAFAAVRGFNYGAQGQSSQQFEASFKAAAELSGAEDFTGARLYTMVQEGTTNTPSDAIAAAIDSKTTLLLGLWASSPQSTFDNEIAALKTVIQQHGSDLANLVTGISVGSEDLYRISVTGLANDPLGVGQTPDTLVDYIGQVREAISGTAFGSVPVGHVDTWNAFINGSSAPVIEACDFLGLDEYPYFQTTDPNSIDNGANLFFEAYDRVKAIAGGREIWVTEAGWPVSGPQSGAAVASVENAALFWHQVACELQKREINFWWYILEDPATNINFSVSKNGQPLYDLSCNATSGYTPTNNSTSSNSTSSGSDSEETTSGTGSNSTDEGSGAGGHAPSGTASGSDGGATTSTGSGNAAATDSTGAAGRIEYAFSSLALVAMVAAMML